MSQLVRYKKFEVLTKPGSVRKYRDGKLGWNNVLAADFVFTNSKKGNVAKSKDLKAAFSTEDVIECAKIIVEKGDLQVSAAERKEDMIAHRRKVIGYIHKTYIDEHDRPHPTTRLEGVVDDSKVRLDERGSARDQAEEIVKKMRGILVFKKSSSEYTIFIEHKYAKKCSGIVYKHSEVVKEEWDNQGCKWVLNIGSSDFNVFCSELNKLTGGDYLMATGRTDPRENREVETDLNKKSQKRKGGKGKGKGKKRR